MSAMVLDRENALRECMRRVASTVAIVTAPSEAGPVGITATAVSSVSMEPPTLLACVNRKTRLHAAILQARQFRVSFLHEDQSPVASAFGGGGPGFAAGQWSAGDEAHPRLVRPLASLDCDLMATMEVGSHTIFVGAVAAAIAGEGNPLLYRSGTYCGCGTAMGTD